MKLKLFRVICWFILFANSYCQTTIDDTLTKHIDVTGDNVKDKIVLNLKAKSFNDPFVWTLTIFSKGEKILSYVSDDSWMDSFFSDKGFVDDNCQNYEECKRQYYYKDFLNSLVRISTLESNPYWAVKTNKGSVYEVLGGILRDKFLCKEEKIEQIVKNIVKEIKEGKKPLIYIPGSPVQSKCPRVFIKELGKFVQVYQW